MQTRLCLPQPEPEPGPEPEPEPEPEPQSDPEPPTPPASHPPRTYVACFAALWSRPFFASCHVVLARQGHLRGLD